jgi:hypothetical protein
MDSGHPSQPGTEGARPEARRDWSAGVRAVLCVAGSANLEGLDLPWLETVRVATAYEAAAELLAAPTAALVVDLRLVAGLHLRLLAVARQMGAEVLAVGAVPAGLTAEDLSGVRLMARSALAKTLADLRGAPAGQSPRPIEPPAAPASEPEPIEPEPAEPVSQPLGREDGQYLTEQSVADLLNDIPQVDLPLEEARPQTPARPQVSKKQPIPVHPSELLTSEEISALLEDQP